MITVTINKRNDNSKPTSDMQIGEVGVVKDSPVSENDGTLIMRHWGGWVDLENPMNTWDKNNGPEGRVDLMDITIKATYQ